MSKPETKDVVEHLMNTVHCYSPETKPAVHFILENVYKYLNLNLTEVPRVMAHLVGQPWVWHGDGFASTDQVTFENNNIDLRPHSYPLPLEFDQFSNLWRQCNIKENVDLVEVLNVIRNYHDASRRSSYEIKRDVQISVNILNHLSDNIERDKFQLIYIPISTRDGDKLVMKKLSECTFCDKEWYQHGLNVEDLEDDALSHS